MLGAIMVDAPATEPLAQRVLQALAAMARTSRHHEAEFESATARAGIWLDALQRVQVLSDLITEGHIDRVVPLSDGGIMVHVTSRGEQMARYGR